VALAGRSHRRRARRSLSRQGHRAACMPWWASARWNTSTNGRLSPRGCSACDSEVESGRGGRWVKRSAGGLTQTAPEHLRGGTRGTGSTRVAGGGLVRADSARDIGGGLSLLRAESRWRPQYDSQTVRGLPLRLRGLPLRLTRECF
jgi:hypothetical protein